MMVTSTHRAHTRRGTSLVELLIVVAIMGVFAALAAPRYAASVQRRRFQSAALRIQSDIAVARESARATSSERTLRFSTTDNSYQLLGSNALNGGRPGSVQLDEPPYRATLPYADFGGSPDLVFDGYGRVVAGGEIHLRIGAMSARIVLAAHDAGAEDPDAGGGNPDGGDGDDGGGGLLGPILGLLGL